jgi:hypothetical protein
VLRCVYLENAARVLRLDPGVTAVDSTQAGERQEPAERDVRP